MMTPLSDALTQMARAVVPILEGRKQVRQSNENGGKSWRVEDVQR